VIRHLERIAGIGFDRKGRFVIESAPTHRANAQPLPPDAAQLRAALASYAQACPVRSSIDILTSLVAYLALSVGMYLLVAHSPWITLALAPASAMFLLRTYIVFHDCSHGSFLRSRRGNLWVGTFCGLLVLSPFLRWRHDHAVHHACSGDLDRRGVGDLPTLTVSEYFAKTARGRLAYRIIRNPLVMFGFGPIFAMIIGPRIVARNARPRMRNSVLGTDLALAAIAASLIWLMGLGPFLLVWAPAALISGAVGIWLFYVQHQFEDAYWERGERWNYADAALRGSSFLKLSRPLQFATGHIGYHHIHHLSARIPNYNLPRAHTAHPLFATVPTLTLWEGLRTARLKLWHAQSGRMVTFAQAHALHFA
jgi:omega-6 fatty acid desaturase (delta-12 desaturase)